jgi:hypothetical protein
MMNTQTKPKGFTYKNTYEIEADSNVKTILKKRFAVAINSKGLVILNERFDDEDAAVHFIANKTSKLDDNYEYVILPIFEKISTVI